MSSSLLSSTPLQKPHEAVHSDPESNGKESPPDLDAFCPICYEAYDDDDDDVDIPQEQQHEGEAIKSNEEEQRDTADDQHHHDKLDLATTPALYNNMRQRIVLLSTSSSCQHAFCRECWLEYCRQAIPQTKAGTALTCPGKVLSVQPPDQQQQQQQQQHVSDVTMPPPVVRSWKRTKRQCKSIKESTVPLPPSSSSATAPPPAVLIDCSTEISDVDLQTILASCPTEAEQTQLWNRYQRQRQMHDSIPQLECLACKAIFDVTPVVTAVTASASVKEPLADRVVANQASQIDHDGDGAQGGVDATPTTPSLMMSTTSSSIVTCPECAYSFCQQHGNAHPPSQASCVAYQKLLAQRHAEQNHLSEQCLRQYTKPCSHCGAHIQKYAGCDHVVCPACQQDMCFQCATHIYLTGKPGSVNKTCQNCQQGFLDHRYMSARQAQCQQCCMLPLLLPGMMLYMALASVTALLTCGFACCFGCGQCLAIPPSEETQQPQPTTTTTQSYTDSDDTVPDSTETTSSATTPATTTTTTFSPLRAIRLGCAVIGLPLLEWWTILQLDGAGADHHHDDDDDDDIANRNPAAARRRRRTATAMDDVLYLFREMDNVDSANNNNSNNNNNNNNNSSHHSMQQQQQQQLQMENDNNNNTNRDDAEAIRGTVPSRSFHGSNHRRRIHEIPIWSIEENGNQQG